MFEENSTSFKGSLLTLLFEPGHLNADQLQILETSRDDLLKVCTQHRLYNWIQRNSKLTGNNIGFRPDTSAIIANEARSESMRALMANGELVRLVKILGTQGIQVMPLKGAHLANFVYPSLEMRPMRDLDITLVDPRRSIEAFEILVSAGYQYPKEFEFDLHQCLIEKKHLPALVAPSRLYFIEIHTALYESELTLSKDMHHLSLLTTNRRFKNTHIADHEIQLMSPEDLFVHIAVHSAKESRFSNGPVCFLDLLTLGKSAQFDWPQMIQIALQLGQIKSVELVCAVLKKLDQSLEQIEALKNLSNPVPNQLVLASLRNSLADTRVKPKQKRLLAHGSWLDKSRLLKSQLFPGTAQLRKLYPAENTVFGRIYRHSQKIALEMVPKWREGKKGLAGGNGQEEIQDWLSVSAFLD